MEEYLSDVNHYHLSTSLVELSKREAFFRLSVGIFNEDNSDIYTLLQVINDLLDPAGQNLRVREDAQVSCFL